MTDKFMQPKNPILYAFLHKLTGGRVRISREGESCIWHNHLGRIEIDSGGEEYAICCPMCGDTRYRCYVNHRFGTRFADKVVTNCAHCFNEECQSKPDKNLIRYLKSEYRSWRFGQGIRETSDTIQDDAQSAPLSLDELIMLHNNRVRELSGVSRLSALSRHHPAWKYLIRRGFSPSKLDKIYHVGYKGESQEYSVANARLIVPILCKGVRVGWQARAIDGHTHLSLVSGREAKSWPYKEPKYYTSPGLAKSKFLYNIDAAAQADPVAIVEGVADVWNCGTWATAILGKSMSRDQINLLMTMLGDRRPWIYLIADDWDGHPDVEKSWRTNFARLQNIYPEPEKIRLIRVPGGDPGNVSHSELRKLMLEA